MNRLVLAGALILAVYVLHKDFGTMSQFSSLPQVGSDQINPTGMVYTGKIDQKL